MTGEEPSCSSAFLLLMGEEGLVHLLALRGVCRPVGLRTRCEVWRHFWLSPQGRARCAQLHLLGGLLVCC